MGKTKSRTKSTHGSEKDYVEKLAELLSTPKKPRTKPQGAQKR